VRLAERTERTESGRQRAGRSERRQRDGRGPISFGELCCASCTDCSTSGRLTLGHHEPQTEAGERAPRQSSAVATFFGLPSLAKVAAETSRIHGRPLLCFAPQTVPRETEGRQLEPVGGCQREASREAHWKGSAAANGPRALGAQTGGSKSQRAELMKRAPASHKQRANWAAKLAEDWASHALNAHSLRPLASLQAAFWPLQSSLRAARD